jgi:hypothetical protein
MIVDSAAGGSKNNINNKFEKQRSDGHAKSYKGSSAARE